MKIKIGSDSLGSSVSKEQLSDRLDRKEIVRGTALTITGGFLWGLAGVYGKYSFEYKGVMAPWLVNVRLIIMESSVSGKIKDMCSVCWCME